MAQAALYGRKRRPFWPRSRVALGWALLIALTVFLVLAAIGLARSAGVAGRWLLSLPERGAAPSAVLRDPPPPAAPEVPPPAPPSVELAPAIPFTEEPSLEEGQAGAPGDEWELATEPEPTLESAPAPEPEELVSCGTQTCAPGLVCCNALCGICAPPGEGCPQQACDHPVAPVSQSCGINTCNVGQVCCNPSCGRCVPYGQVCDPTPCLFNPIKVPTSQPCGMQTCDVGKVCCNPTCGTCTAPGEECSREPCT